MPNSNFKLRVNYKFDFDLDKSILGEQDIIATDATSYHMITSHSSVKAEVLSCDLENKLVEVNVAGVKYAVSIADTFDQLIKKMGLSANVVRKISDVKAPMPGLVLEMLVKEGDELQEGDSIMILEAMKMENVIKAPGPMTIKEILISKGEAVEKNQILINLED